jgi:hypothetical protein
VLIAVVGNEDGAHNFTAQLGQALGRRRLDPAACYWVGEAMGDVDFKDLKKVPD